MHAMAFRKQTYIATFLSYINFLHRNTINLSTNDSKKRIVHFPEKNIAKAFISVNIQKRNIKEINQ